jgi:hypothetical protein
MSRLFKRKRAIVALGSVVALVLAAGAYAYFTSTGTGTGTVGVGSSTAFAVAFGTTTGGPLYPGAGSQALPYTVTNPAGGGSQSLTTTTASVASSGGNVTQAGTPVPGCLSTWFTATNTPPASINLGPGASTTGSVAVTMQDSGTNQDPCQGAAPDITVKAS